MKTASDRRFRVNLQQLILLLALTGVLVLLINSLVISSQVQRDLVIESTLASNHAYAAKQAVSISEFLGSSQQQLAYSAGALSARFNNPDFLLEEVTRLNRQTNSFNSVVLGNQTGVVLATDPQIGLLGSALQSDVIETALREQRAEISTPFISVTGNLVVFISQPVFSPEGEYLGFIGGTVYLKAENMLSFMIKNHFHTDGSYVYIIDQNRRLLFHPNADLIGTTLGANQAVDLALAGQSGEMRLLDTSDTDMLAGYAPVAQTGWGVIAQRPTDQALTSLETSIKKVLVNSLPLAFIIVVGIIWLSRRIASPLNNMAESAKSLDQPGIEKKILATRAWYFEAAELKRALLLGVSLMHGTIERLNHDAQVDALTGLFNRRRQDETLTQWSQEERPFALLEMDIDFFKQVNDTFGHDAGDRVLQTLASLMRECTQSHDVLCRVGGEEFTLLLPNTSSASAVEVAQRLRTRVENAIFPEVGHITVSIGVAHWPEHVEDIADVFKLADEMLYKAKRGGRNRVETRSCEMVGA